MGILRLLLVLVFLGAAGLGGYWWLQSQGVISMQGPQLTDVSSISSGTLPNLTATVTSTANTIIAGASQQLAGLNLGGQTTKTTVLGVEDEASGGVTSSGVEKTSREPLVSSTKPPLYQRAFEYARYSYCREVVRDYEERY